MSTAASTPATAVVSERLTVREVPIIAVVGLGYVGLPLAIRFAQAKVRVIGFDVNARRVAELTRAKDHTNEVPTKLLRSVSIDYTADPSVLAEANFIIVAVPTPVDAAKQPDLGPVRGAAQLIGQHIAKGTTVVLESTVYPGVTEEVLAPEIAEASGLVCGKEFYVGYSPERANPGDSEHTVDKVIKIVSGMNSAVLDRVDEVYSLVCKAGTHRAPNIRTAEAAKVIENIQRDLNIALMNELALIFGRLGLSTHDVLAAAGTKWNFHHYTPGLVGGHCIPVDPYYLTYLAEKIGYHPEVVLAGRRINDAMPQYLAQLCIKSMIASGRPVKGARVAVLGLMFKENVKDTRNSKVRDLLAELQGYQVELLTYDPLLTVDEVAAEFGGEPINDVAALEPVDAIVLAVAHTELKSRSLNDYAKLLKLGGVFVDVRGIYRDEVKPTRITYIAL